ncbi:MAG: histidinol-phosphatase [Gemmatimonadaceae bacterium]
MRRPTQLLLEAVHDVARLAGDIALRHFRSALTVDTKADGSPVTVADREAERAARSWIEKRFPHDGILGEEFGADRADAARRWIIDPIDGTKSFVRGVPLWGTLIALAAGEEILAGAAYYPAVDEMLAAARGTGCWWNDSRCAVSQISAVSDATVLTTDERFDRTPWLREPWGRLASRAAVARSWGDCFGYLMVATGRAEVMVDGVLGPWDLACFAPIIEEAGGVITDARGGRTAFGGSGLATNLALDLTVRDILIDRAARSATALPTAETRGSDA